LYRLSSLPLRVYDNTELALGGQLVRTLDELKELKEEMGGGGDALVTRHLGEEQHSWCEPLITLMKPRRAHIYSDNY
jgi:hypothetical protein